MPVRRNRRPGTAACDPAALRPRLRFPLLLVLVLMPLASGSPPDGLPILFHPASASPADGWRIAGFGVNGTVTGQGIEIRDGVHPLSLRFVGARPEAVISACGEPLSRVSYFRGNDPSAWRRGIPASECLAIRGIYSGIDLHLSGSSGRIKSEWVVAPGANPSDVRLRYAGARKVEVLAGGSLLVETEGGQWHEDAPLLFQSLGGATVTVAGPYRVEEDGLVSFEAGIYDRAAPLVIDPVITFSTLLGGTGLSSASGIAVDPAGNVLIVGYTDASDFPTASPLLPRGGGVDAIAAKINPSTGRLLWATYIGGAYDDRATAVSAAPDGSVFIAGGTSSPDFPVASAWQSLFGGVRDAFLLKLSGTGETLVFSTYFGGNQSDSAAALAMDAASVWAAGETNSTNLSIVGGYQTTKKGGQDGFAAKFSLTGVLQASTYSGGSGDETIRAAVLDPSGNIYLAGGTSSADFTMPPGAYQSALKGSMDGFIVRISANAAQLLHGTYLGGTGGSLSQPEIVNALAIDAAQNIYAGGWTPSADFPTPSAWVGTKSGTDDGFLDKLSPTLSGAAWGTFLGGGAKDYVNAAAVSPDGMIWAGGATTSPNFPTQSPIQAGNAGGSDGFLLQINPAGNLVPFSTYLGGSGGDAIMALAVSTSGTVHMAGQSASTDFPLKNQTQNYGGAAVRLFVTRAATGTLASNGTLLPGSGAGSTQVFQYTATHPGGASQISALDLLIGATLDSRWACLVRYNKATGKLELADDAALSWLPVTPGSAAVVQNTQCALSGTGSSVTLAGNTLSVSANLAFRAAFAGSRLSYVNSRNTSGEETGFELKGAWTVLAPTNLPPALGTVTPSGTSGPGAVFTATFSDPNGASDIALAAVLFNTLISDAAACSVRIDRAANLILLANDTASNWYSGRPGATGVLMNSQCQVNLAGSSVSMSGNTLTAALDIGFQPLFFGTKNIYASVKDTGNASAGPTAIGQYTVLSGVNVAPAVVGVSPANATGPGQLLTFTFSDANGASDIVTPRVLINAVQQAAGACYVAWDRPTGTIYLADDYAFAWTSVQAGSAQATQNSQCVIRGAGSMITLSGTNLTMVLDVLFKASFNGLKNIYANATDAGGLTSPAPNIGTYTVAVQQNVAPVAGTLTPASGSGAAQVFTITYTDSNGAPDIVKPRLLINAVQSGVSACFVEFDRLSGTLWLADDSGGGWTGAQIGSNALAQNSQCTVKGAGSSYSMTGVTFALTLDIVFKAAFNGAKYVYANATDAGGLTSSSPQVGTYTVSATGNQAPAAVSVSPSSGSGAGQVFTFTWTDVNGATDIETPRVLIHSVQSAAGGCYAAYSQSSQTVSLADDAGLGWITAHLGANETIANSQCSIKAIASSLTASGNTLTGTLSVVFHAAFNGAKNIWANATDSGGLTSPAPQLGTYTVAAIGNQAPVPVSVSPASGSGKRQVFTFAWTDANGATDVETPRVLFHSVQQANGACYIALSQANSLIYLSDDAGVSWAPIQIGTGQTAQNSQCTVYAATSSFTAAGNTLTVNLDIGFKPAFVGSRNIWANATDAGGLTSPAPQLGTYTVTP